MASQTGICNRALEKLGESPIVSISDNTDQAKALKRVYNDSLSALLVDHPWHFAKKRAALPTSATAPVFGYTNSYPVPTDFLRLLLIQNGSAFSLEADPSGTQTILSNASAPLSILYVYLVSDPGRLPPHFVEAFSSKLALDICDDITSSNTKMQIMQARFAADLLTAKRINGLQKSPDAFPEFSWLASRQQSGWSNWPPFIGNGEPR